MGGQQAADASPGTGQSRGDPVENPPTPAQAEFEQLLSATPAIARAIKQFDDPEIRRSMFEHLVSTLLGGERQPPTSP
jgi:hypothetical protein